MFYASYRRALDFRPVDAIVERFVDETNRADVVSAHEVEAERHLGGRLWVVGRPNNSLRGAVQDLYEGDDVVSMRRYLWRGALGGLEQTYQVRALVAGGQCANEDARVGRDNQDFLWSAGLWSAWVSQARIWRAGRTVEESSEGRHGVVVAARMCTAPFTAVKSPEEAKGVSCFWFATGDGGQLAFGCRVARPQGGRGRCTFWRSWCRARANPVLAHQGTELWYEHTTIWSFVGCQDMADCTSY